MSSDHRPAPDGTATDESKKDDKDGKPQKLTGDAAAIGRFVDRFDTFLFDCDGVLWSGPTPFPHIAHTLSVLRSPPHSKRLLFVTNNSSKSRASYAAKLSALTPPLLQNPAISPRDIYTSSSSAALFLSQVLKLPTTGPARVFVLGEAGIEEELAALGIPCLRPSSDTSPVPSAPDFAALSSPTALLPTISIVLSGLDFHPTYAKYALAHQYLLRPLPATATEGMPAEFLAMAAGKTLFLATNGDVTLPAAGTSFPGAGAMGAVLVASTGRVAVGMGKPGRRMMDAVLAGVALNSSAGGGGKGETLDRARCVMVGDRLDTDIVFGNESGLGGTLAVCTGVTDEEEILGVREGDPRRPGAWVETLGDLLLGLVGEGAEGGGEEGEMGGGDLGKVGG